MIKIPASLKKGDQIGVICPGGFMEESKVLDCKNTLESWGYKVKFGKTIGGDSVNYFSGNDEDRLRDIQEMLDDDNIKAILCARGGYGLGRIIYRINFKKFRKNPKWIIGYSDNTVFHSYIAGKLKIATIHGPMAAAFSDVDKENEYLISLKNVLKGKKINYKFQGSEYNKPGTCQGILTGGNLALIAHLCGTPADINTKGKILFLEDIGEYLYNIDRMIYQLKHSGKFDDLSGLILGGFSDLKDTTRPFGKNIYELFHDIFKDYNFPVCYNFPVSHERENLALVVGKTYELKVGMEKGKLVEL